MFTVLSLPPGRFRIYSKQSALESLAVSGAGGLHGAQGLKRMGLIQQNRAGLEQGSEPLPFSCPLCSSQTGSPWPCGTAAGDQLFSLHPQGKSTKESGEKMGGPGVVRGVGKHPGWQGAVPKARQRVEKVGHSQRWGGGGLSL